MTLPNQTLLKTTLTLLSFLFLLFSCSVATTSDPSNPPPITPDVTQYTVTFNSKGGSSILSQTIASNSLATEPAFPTKQNLVFAGWFSDSTLNTPFDFTTPISTSITLYAKWDITVTFDSNGGSTVPSRIIASNSTTTKPTPPSKQNLVFAGWFSDSIFNTPFDFTTPINTSITLYAKWTVTVTFDSQGGSAVSTKIVAQNTTTTKPTPPTKQNFIFAGWFINQSLNTTFDFNSSITTNITLYAQWNNKVQPTSKGELSTLIDQAINSNGDNANLNFIDTSLITDMSSLFYNKTRFNGDISKWDTSNVTNMSEMFRSAATFNQPIGNWNTSQVTSMNNMFESATAFNQPIANWDTSQVASMRSMFFRATDFNQPIGNWNTSQVTSMSFMFSSAAAFNQPIGNWNTSQVTSMSFMFSSAAAFNQPIDNWNTSQVTNMYNMFNGAIAFNQPIDNWNTSQVTDMASMFTGATDFNQPIGNWSTTNVKDMSGMFTGATDFNQPLNNWNTSQVISMSGMFAAATDFNQPLNSWNTANVKDMSQMFSGAKVFNQNLNNWNTSQVTSMSSIFNGSAMENNKPSWCTGTRCD